MMRRTLTALCLVLAVPGGSAAQSLFNSVGLGAPLEGLDARARSMGALGPGLLGGSVLPLDPSSGARVLLPTLSATMQPTWGTYEQGTASGDLQGVRFPLIVAAYPTGGIGVLTATYRGAFDQRWQAERTGSFPIGGEDVASVDRFSSRGGIAIAEVGWARRFGTKLGLGASLGRYTGRLDRVFTRTLDSLAVGSDVATFNEGAAAAYSGVTAAVGFHVDPTPLIRVGGALRFGGTLKQKAKEGSAGGELEYSMPTEIRLGASAALTSRLMLAASFARADWSGADGGVADIEPVGSVTTYGFGAEWGGPRFLGRTVPIRLGYRRSGLPYRYASGDPVESAVSAGLALNLAQIDEFTLAGIDLALERGTRSDDVLSERFWRMTASLRVSGN